ncbi:MAG: hypothetical protein CVU54_14695 [Deltaproteobacteria bacterium HGW-Deltaproteobacteria-12]|jgi:predicted ATP-dependent serine protease|nr:MAG: hypothetical protein CVU54_14695 [Deltaproteobacteria bacterium HGW-Deltaproteobacteria-12]
METNFIETFAGDPWETEICTLSHAFAKREPLNYAVDGLFPLPCLGLVYGHPGTLKSLILADTAMHIAGGLQWLGKAVKKIPVLWVDLDNGKRRTHERFEALARGINLTEEASFYYTSMLPYNAGNSKDTDLLIKRMLSLGIKFLIIDNLGLISPGADENSDAMIAVMSNLRRVAEETGAAVVVVHHQRKSQSARAGETLRGHSSIESAVDLCLLVERDPDSNTINIKSTKSRDVEVYPFAAEFNYDHKEGTNELYRAWFDVVQVEDVSSDRAAELKIMDVVSERPLGNQKIIIEDANRALRVGKNRLRLILGSLVKKGKLKVREGARGAKLYVIE